jgi:quinol monooxygenase YgiN
MQEGYETKKKTLEQMLESAEKNLQGSTLAQGRQNYDFYRDRTERNNKRGRDEYVEKYKHKDSMFKRPAMPINKCLKSRQRPDYEVILRHFC